MNSHQAKKQIVEYLKKQEVSSDNILVVYEMIDDLIEIRTTEINQEWQTNMQQAYSSMFESVMNSVRQNFSNRGDDEKQGQ